ncbi:MAG: PhzF family phenazine biosynthesis protein, partial [Ignavibacteriaceae bacterium]|nr:PhzF family phenazine biosynthesis protein [Ignavibacteriaceae bacterium]
DKPFGGNPAGVTFGDGLSKEEMQFIAREMNVAETAFISKSDKADYNLRWFTPTTEVELCGHATIASLHFLYENRYIVGSSEITFDTQSGILKCRVEKGKCFMQIPVYKAEEYNDNKEEILTALGLSIDNIDNSVPFIMMENRYLYIYVKKLSTLKGLKPNFTDLLGIQKLYNIGGNVVFTKETYDKESFAHSRFFTPYYGIDEDPVTGSANGPFMLVLRKLGFVKNNEEDISLIFEQGDIIGRRGRVGVKYSPTKNELYISGNAVTVLKGEMNF